MKPILRVIEKIWKESAIEFENSKEYYEKYSNKVDEEWSQEEKRYNDALEAINNAYGYKVLMNYKDIKGENGLNTLEDYSKKFEYRSEIKNKEIDEIRMFVNLELDKCFKAISIMDSNESYSYKYFCVLYENLIEIQEKHIELYESNKEYIEKYNNGGLGNYNIDIQDIEIIRPWRNSAMENMEVLIQCLIKFKEIFDEISERRLLWYIKIIEKLETLKSLLDEIKEDCIKSEINQRIMNIPPKSYGENGIYNLNKSETVSLGIVWSKVGPNFEFNKTSFNIPIDSNMSIFFENQNNFELGKETIINIIDNLICDMPNYQINNIFIDTCYAGGYFTEYNDIRKINKSLVGEKIYITKNEITKILDDMMAEVVEITQNKLKDQYANIYEYNKENKESAEPIRIITILGFANLFDNTLINKLMNLATNGPRCGVNLFIENTHRTAFGNCEDEIRILKSKMRVIEVEKYNITLEEKDKYGINDEKCSIARFEKIPYEGDKKDRLQFIANKFKEKEDKSFKLSFKENVEGNPGEKLAIPIGKNSRGEIQMLGLGKGTQHHGLIAGQTGSGKSTLLHTIILSSIQSYSPNDLNIYLIDFKEGIEFKIYSKYRIPQVKLIALESQVEFGESVLDFMVKEIQRRGKLFKATEVENLKGYIEKTGKKIPRILLIIDEFTSLFSMSQDLKVTRRNAQLMNKIINQGRAFGVNVLMASQTIKNTSDTTLAPETIAQMAVRIGLKCSEMDANALMGQENNEISRLGNEVGAAIYNGENGKGENFRFKIAYIDEQERHSILKNIEEKYQREYSEYECRVFDGNDTINIQNNKNSIFNNDEKIKLNKFSHSVWIGESIKMGESMSIRFNQGINNLAIISSEEDASRSILMYVIMSILRQVRLLDDEVEQGMIRFIDYNYTILDESESFKELVEGNKDIIENYEMTLSKVMIAELYEEYEKRRDSDNYKVTPRYLIINGISRARDLLIKEREEKVKNDFARGFSRDFEKTVNLSLLEKFKCLVKDGGNFGIFVILTADSYRNYEKIDEKLGYIFRKNINLRIAFNMNAREGDTFVNTQGTEKLNENTAVFYDDITGIGTKFIRYEEPTIEWIKEKYVENIYVKGE